MKNPSSLLNRIRMLKPIILPGLALLAALLLPLSASAGNLVGRYATITLDGSLSDWQPDDTMYNGTEITAGAPQNATFTNVMVANDANFVYVALQIPAPASIANTWTYSLFVDADLTASTGFNGGWMSGGYDHLVQFGGAGSTYSAFGFTGAGQADWTWNWLGLIEYASSDTAIEWAIPLSSLGATTNRIRMEFSVSGESVTTETWAYQWESGVGTYTIAAAPPATPPEMVSVEGAPNKVQITFSKAVAAATANVAANYTLSGGLTVLTATLNTSNPRVVTLTTSPQTRGTSYTLTVNKVADDTGSPIAQNSAKTFASSILIDGTTDDWDGLPVLYSNDQGDSSATNFKEVYAYNDANYIYFRLTLWEPSNLLSAQNNIFIDCDNDPATGNAFWGGSELLIQSGTGYQEKNGGFNEGLIDGLDFVVRNIASTDYEFRIARGAKYVSDGMSLFTTNVIHFAFDGEKDWATVNRMPFTNGETIAYEFVEASTPPGPLAIGIVNGHVALSWEGDGTLQSTDAVVGGTWTDIPTATSPYTIDATGKQLFFRLAR